MSIDRQDPDPFTIATLVIAGAALLLNLEQKIEARNESKKQTENEKSKSRVILSLYRIRKYLNSLESFWIFFAEIGESEIVQNEKGFEAYGMSRKYFSLDEYERFNDYLDEVLSCVGRINKELYSIKLDDIHLDEDLRVQFVNKIKNLRESLNFFLDNRLKIVEKLKAVQFNLNFAREIIEELSLVLGANIAESTFSISSIGKSEGGNFIQLHQ